MIKKNDGKNNKNFGEDTVKSEHCALLLGMENGKQLGGSSKVKHQITIGPSNFTPKSVPPKLESRDLNKYL